MFHKTIENEDQLLAILELQNTGRQDLNVNPAVLMLSRKTRSEIPRLFKPNSNFNAEQRQKRQYSFKSTMIDKPAYLLSQQHIVQNVISHVQIKRNDTKVLV